MSTEEDAGANYLAALRQSSAPHSAHQDSGAAPAPALELPQSRESRYGESRPRESRSANAALPSNTTPARPELRKSPRYKCSGSARLQESGSAASTWATFSDISLHGCYVESAAPCRVGTLLDLRLEAQGFRIETMGEVCVAYPGLGMGISFVRMSESDREHLRELVRSISRPSVNLASRVATPPVTMSPSDSPPVCNPSAVVQAILKFFEDRHMLGREEFLRILRNSQ